MNKNSKKARDRRVARKAREKLREATFKGEPRIKKK